MNTSTTAIRATECPGCSGQGKKNGINGNPCVVKCDRCGGLFTIRTIGWQECLEFVNLNAPMLANSEAQQYFDFCYAGPSCGGGKPVRVHGWFDRITKRVVQWG